jgi:hypothetical protein
MKLWMLTPLSQRTEMGLYANGPMGVAEIRQLQELLAIALRIAETTATASEEGQP